MDGDIGVDTVEKEKILQDARNKFICYIYSTGSPLETTIKDLTKVMLLFESLFIFFYFLVSAKIWLAKRPSCAAISCSWAATRLASMVAFLISVAFCTNFCFC